MPNKPDVSRTVNIQTEKTKYTTDFADLMEKLRKIGLNDDHILDLYLEMIESKKGNKITDFTKLIYGEDESNITIPELIKAYKEMITACREIEPLEFLKQYTAFVKADQYDVEVENGVVGEEFLRLTGSEDRFLIVDPHPLFIEQCLEETIKTKMNFAFSDERYVEILQNTKEKEKYVSLSGIPKGVYNRALYFARNAAPDDITHMVDCIKSRLKPKKESTIYIFLPTSYLEKKTGLWNFVSEHFTFNKIILFGSGLVKVKPIKKSLVVLNNVQSGKNGDILIQKTRRKDENNLEFLEFRRVKAGVFIRSNRTLSELYDTDYIDYSVPKSRKRADEYRFTNELTIYVSVTEDEMRGFRPQYSIYDYPTVAQERKNVLPRGKLIQQQRGKWYPTREEAVASAELILLNDKDLAKKVREIMNARYYGEVISLKSHVFLHLEKLEKRKDYDKKFIDSLFFQPYSAQMPLCNLSVGMATAADVQKIVDAIVSERKVPETKEDYLWKTIDWLFSYAVAEERYQKNPISTLLDDSGRVRKNKRTLRSKMALTSFSEDQEHQFLQIVISNLNSPIYIMMLVKFFTGLAVNLLRAMEVEDFVLNPELNLYQLAITKTCRAREQTTYKLPKSKERYFPLPSMIAEIITAYLKNRKGKPNQRLFAFAETPNKPISEKQFWWAFNKVLDQLEMSEYKISIADGDNVPVQTDIDAYGGDLLRENFVFHAKEYALMSPGDIDTLLGSYPDDSGRRYYLAYKDPFVQLALRTMLDRWVARLMLPETAICTVDETDEEYIIRGAPTKTKSELVIEADVDFNPDNCDASVVNELILLLYAEYGAAVSIEFVEENE